MSEMVSLKILILHSMGSCIQDASLGGVSA